MDQIFQDSNIKQVSDQSADTNPKATKVLSIQGAGWSVM